MDDLLDIRSWCKKSVRLGSKPDLPAALLSMGDERNGVTQNWQNECASQELEEQLEAEGWREMTAAYGRQ